MCWGTTGSARQVQSTVYLRVPSSLYRRCDRATELTSACPGYTDFSSIAVHRNTTHSSFGSSILLSDSMTEGTRVHFFHRTLQLHIVRSTGWCNIRLYDCSVSRIHVSNHIYSMWHMNAAPSLPRPLLGAPATTNKVPPRDSTSKTAPVTGIMMNYHTSSFYSVTRFMRTHSS